MIDFVLMCLYLILPGAVANMVPAMFRNCFKKYAYPVDFGLKFRGKRVLGANKSYKGLLLGVVAAVIVAFIQKMLYVYPFFQNISFIDYFSVNFVLLGFLLGFGALFGDLVESFVKRQFNVAPGKPFIPWDQLDFVLGMILFISFVKVLTWQMLLFYVLVIPFLHVLFNLIGYGLGLQKNKL